MTDVYFEGKKAAHFTVARLGENLVTMQFVFEDGTKEQIGCFKEEI